MNNKRELVLYSIFIVLFLALIGMTIYLEIHDLMIYSIPLVLALSSISLILSLLAVGLLIYASIKKFKDKEFNVNTVIMILMLITLKNPINENISLINNPSYNSMHLTIIILIGISIVVSLLSITIFKKNKLVNLILSSLGIILITTSLVLDMSGSGMDYVVITSILEILTGLVSFIYVTAIGLNTLKN